MSDETGAQMSSVEGLCSYGFELRRDGSLVTLWNEDIPAQNPDVNLYGSHPFYMEVLPGEVPSQLPGLPGGKIKAPLCTGAWSAAAWWSLRHAPDMPFCCQHRLASGEHCQRVP